MRSRRWLIERCRCVLFFALYLIDRATPYDGHKHLDVRDLRGGYLEEISIEDDEIGELAGLKCARLGVLMKLIGRVHGDRPQYGFSRKAGILTQSACVLRTGVR